MVISCFRLKITNYNTVDTVYTVYKFTSWNPHVLIRNSVLVISIGHAITILHSTLILLIYQTTVPRIIRTKL